MKSILTVTQPSTTFDLTVVATVKAELGITNRKSDDQLAVFIRQASGAAASYCNRVFALEGIKEEFWPDRDGMHHASRLLNGGLSVLQLRRYPIAEMTLVTENGVALTEDTDFRVDAENGFLYRINASGFTRHWRTWPLVVEYSGGYALLDELPFPIERAVINMVKTAYNAAKRDPLIMSESIPGIRDVRYWVPSGGTQTPFTSDVVELLDNFRVPQIG